LGSIVLVRLFFVAVAFRTKKLFRWACRFMGCCLITSLPYNFVFNDHSMAPKQYRLKNSECVRW